ncbi:hypothetical protein [Cellulomonas xiejunii]|uniref:hypothetical protein n=1 Tax=Cellulomonas xiejunii TaxID=2968083 RepID=UPI001D0EE98D|nr:hypothetical protein [Cellulomonas xiejunii]MCC2313612.1 hypothetical protein [Cellulomonas xiejunii]
MRITAPVDALRGLRDIGGLTIYPPTIEDLGDGRYRVAGHGPTSVVPELRARGCDVRVLMSAHDDDEFNQDVARTVTLPPEFVPPDG